jgi:hypothetical protein
MIEPEFKWVAKGLMLDQVRLMVNELLRTDQPSGSFKIIENGTFNKKVDHAVMIKHDRYDMYFDDFSCGLLQAAWDGWDPQPNCGHASLDGIHSRWYPHCSEMTCWNYLNKNQAKPTSGTH